MDVQALLDHAHESWWILPLLVLVARVLDVSLGTLRVMFVSRSLKVLAPVVGFFEVLIWIAAVAQVVRSANSGWCYLAYATGFGLGTYIGLLIEDRLALGTLILRIILPHKGDGLVSELRGRNIGVTCIDGQGASGPVKIIFAVLRRGDLPAILESVRQHSPGAFYTVEDIRTLNKGVFPLKT